MEKKLNDLIDKALSRRSFLAGASTVAAATVLAGCNASETPAATTPVPTTTTPTPTTTAPPVSTTAPTPTDADYLNFALNLEYLEAQFYSYAATGAGLQTADTSGGSASGFPNAGTITVGNAAHVPNLTSDLQKILNELAYTELQHVRFLRTALGNSAVGMPDIDLSFFGPLAVAAGITTAQSAAFNPFASYDGFLVGVFIFEDVGVTTYAGAAGLLTDKKVNLPAAAGILSVEAYHAAYARLTLTSRAYAASATSPATAYPYLTYANMVEALRATLTVGDSAAPSTMGSVETALIVPTSVSTATAIVPADPVNAIGFARTVNQVHHIVYGDPTVGVAKGGFFPNGTNSIFATTTA